MSDGEQPKKMGRPIGSGAPAFDWRVPRGQTVATIPCPACGRPVPMKPSEKGRLSGICPHAYGDYLEPCNTKVFFGIPHSRRLSNAYQAGPAPAPRKEPENERRSFLGRDLD